VKEIVDSGELGTITKIEASLAVSHLFVKDGDIRLVYELGGGAMMDMGCEFDSVVSSRFLRVQFLRLHFVYVAVHNRRRSHENHLSQGRHGSEVPSD